MLNLNFSKAALMELPKQKSDRWVKNKIWKESLCKDVLVNSDNYYSCVLFRASPPHPQNLPKLLFLLWFPFHGRGGHPSSLKEASLHLFQDLRAALFSFLSARMNSLLERYRNDRRKLMEFLMSSGLVKELRSPSGSSSTSLSPADLDALSADYVLDCVKSGRLTCPEENFKHIFFFFAEEHILS